MSFTRYPTYRDSGVKWLGEVPSEWTVIRSDAQLETMHESVSIAALHDNEVFHYSIPVVQETGDGRYEGGSEIESSKLLVEQEAVLVSKLNPRKGTVCIASPKEVLTVCSGEFVPLVSSTLNIRFLLYMVITTNYRFRLESMVESATRSNQRFTPDDISKFVWAFPTRYEQDQIVSFLDHETARIDALVAEQQRLIELLKEKRQAVISHAVTKGLNPDVPMKDSGVEWLGEVPAHWSVVSLKHFLEFVLDVDHYMPASVDSGVPYLMTGDLRTRTSEIDFASCKQISQHDFDRLARKVTTSRGDVIMARYATIGTVCYVDSDREFAVSYSCVTIRPMPGVATGIYLYFYFQSDAFIQGLSKMINANTQDNVGIDDLKKVKVVMPDVEEQMNIVKKLSAELSRLDQVTETSKDAVRLLTERRSALISAAVTGKIDVRGWQPPPGSASPTETTAEEPA